jgi:Tol biopolymer transport system component/DNA-binding winged helix-turn-helix (wHTH) protein
MVTSLIRFGLFELNTASRQLLKQGRRVRLQEQPLRILEVLLERPGQLVTRQQLISLLWPSDVHVDFELGLNGAIKRLRLALDDSSDNPIFIETVPKRGYRFLAPVHSAPAPVNTVDLRAGDVTTAPGGVERRRTVAPQTEPPTSSAPVAQPRPKSRVIQFSIPMVLVTVLLAAGYLLRPFTPALRVTHIAKLSNTGQAWSQESLFSDGPRLYYTSAKFGKGYQLRQILLNGNEDTPVAGIAPDVVVKNLSPDGTTFLSISQTDLTVGRPSPLWIEPVIGGPSRRIGNFVSNDAAWSPDGNSLAFALGHELHFASHEGTGDRIVARAPGTIIYPRWSPDGRRVRYSVSAAQSELTIWEVSADGTNAHPLDFQWSGTPMEGYGEWTADGRFYIFASKRDGVSNLWAIEEETDWLHRRRLEPIQLTAGPINYSRPLPSRDGARIFALGLQNAGELLRYDVATKTFAPYLGGLSADHVDFSRDGQWMTYVSYPDGMLWRARSDGTQQLQLTFPPTRVTNPRWSPDGKRILFVSRPAGNLPKLYTISVDGGNPEPVVSEAHAQTSANWSPQGDFIYYGRDPEGENQDISIYRADVRSGRSENIPGSERLFAPLCSPDGRYLAAQSTSGDHHLILIDLQTNNRTVLSATKVDYPAWSADSQFLYVNGFAIDQPVISRIHVPDGKVQKVTETPFPTTGVYGNWSGLAPDGSPLLFRSHVQTDVYALALR